MPIQFSIIESDRGFNESFYVLLLFQGSTFPSRDQWFPCFVGKNILIEMFGYEASSLSKKIVRSLTPMSFNFYLEVAELRKFLPTYENI